MFRICRKLISHVLKLSPLLNVQEGDITVVTLRVKETSWIVSLRVTCSQPMKRLFFWRIILTIILISSGSSLWNVAPFTSQVEPFPRSVSPAHTTDHRDEDVVSPVDHQRFTTRVAWREDGEGLSEGEQSEGQIEEDQSEVWLWNHLPDHDNSKPMVYTWLVMTMNHIL